MKKLLPCLFVAIGFGVTIGAWAQPPGDGARFRERILEKYDADGDGQLSPEERRAFRKDVEDGKIDVPPQVRERLPGPAGDRLIVENDVEYGRAGDRSLLLDIARPKEPAEAKLPVIVFIHGGGWRSGDKAGGLRQLMPLVASGDYVGASVNYRLSGEATWPAQIHDCKAAIRWVRANAEKYGVDPQRIGVWGGSAGGHLVNMLGTSGGVEKLEGSCGSPNESSRVSCVVAFCGPSDFTGAAKVEGGREPSAVTALLGGSIEEKAELAKEASPITYVSEDDPPFLLVHGTADPIVPLEHAEKLQNALREAGVSATLVKIEGGGHGVGGPEVIQRVRAFFDKHLRGQDVEVSAEPIQGRQGPPGGRR